MLGWAIASNRLRARSVDRLGSRFWETVRTTHPRDQWRCFHFSQPNPVGRRQADVPALLRRVARTLADLGEVEVLDITWSSATNDHGDWPSMTIYYVRNE